MKKQENFSLESANIPEYLQERKKSKLFTFQKYKKVEGGTKKRAKHPKLIVEEKENEYGYMGLTESEKHGHHSNIPLDENPQKGRKDKAYIHTDLRHAPIDDFSGPLENYKLSSKDKKKVVEWLKQHKKKD